ncbi:MAG: tetratricopeptide repeat protein [bacterium]
MSNHLKFTTSSILIFTFCVLSAAHGQSNKQPVKDNPYSVSMTTINELSKLHFSLGDFYIDLYRVGATNKQESYKNAIKNFKKGLTLDPQNVYYHNRLAYVYHLKRRLKEASEEYVKVLELDPPQEVSDKEFELVLKLAPRVYTNPKEFFILEDLAVIMHPEKPFIEYSFFWDDDHDNPDDNDPTDHEKVWIEYDRKNGEVVNVYTYFHRAVLTTTEALEEARKHNNRARINVQWGGHGSLPVGWEKIPTESISVKYANIEKPDTIIDMKTRYEKHVKSIRMPNHPLAKNWPKKFDGSWKEYITFDKFVDLPKMIKKKKMVMKSRWSNAVIDQYFLAYQFYPKIEWPTEVP